MFGSNKKSKEQLSHADIESACEEDCTSKEGKSTKTGYSSKAKLLRSHSRAEALRVDSEKVIGEETNAIPLLKKSKTWESGALAAEQTINEEDW